MNILQVSKGIALAAAIAVCLTVAPNAQAYTYTYKFLETHNYGDGTSTDFYEVTNDQSGNTMIHWIYYDDEGNVFDNDFVNPSPFEGPEEENPHPAEPTRF